MKAKLISMIRQAAQCILDKTAPPVKIPRKESIFKVDDITPEYLEGLRCIVIKGIGYVCVTPSQFTPEDMIKLGNLVALAMKHNSESFDY